MPEDRPWDYDEEVIDDGRPPSHRFSETLHTDERGKTLSFPHQGSSTPAVAAMATGAAALPLLGAGGVAGGLMRGGLSYLGGEALEQMGAPSWLGEAVGIASGTGGLVKGLAKRALSSVVKDEMKKQAIKTAMGETAETLGPRLVGAGATAGARAAGAVAPEVVTGGTAGKAGIQEILKQLETWQAQKLSPGQMVSSLRNVYGVPEAYGRKLVSTLLGGG